ncbi:hypothetical protein [Nesterenkonia pannonica]|nr:hypothetical protein [Nesterenkonia pannonica]
MGNIGLVIIFGTMIGVILNAPGPPSPWRT